jgi:hypothetical protein
MCSETFGLCHVTFPVLTLYFNYVKFHTGESNVMETQNNFVLGFAKSKNKSSCKMGVGYIG